MFAMMKQVGAAPLAQYHRTQYSGRTMSNADLDYIREQVLAKVCPACNVTREDVMSTSRMAAFAWARHVTFYILRTNTRLTLQAIAATFGVTDHGSVIHGTRRVESIVSVYPSDRWTVEKIAFDLFGELAPPSRETPLP